MGYCERPFARVSPPSGGRRAAPLRRKQRGLRARLVCACPACPPLWGFRLLCFMPGCCPTVLRSHFLACPRAVAWARKCLRVWGCTCCGRVCSVGGWGLVFAWGVCVSGCWRACLGWGWWCGLAAPLPRLACLFVCSRPGVGLLACAGWARAGWARGRSGRGGTWLSRPIQCGVRCPAAACAGKERRVGGGGALMVC